MTSEQQPDPFSECQHLVVERNDSVALLTMNRPEAVNATSAQGIHVVQTLLRRPARLGRQRPPPVARHQNLAAPGVLFPPHGVPVASPSVARQKHCSVR